jgi:hypothetical protein
VSNVGYTCKIETENPEGILMGLAIAISVLDRGVGITPLDYREGKLLIEMTPYPGDGLINEIRKSGIKIYPIGRKMD